MFFDGALVRLIGIFDPILKFVTSRRPKLHDLIDSARVAAFEAAAAQAEDKKLRGETAAAIEKLAHLRHCAAVKLLKDPFLEKAPPCPCRATPTMVVNSEQTRLG